MTEARNNTESSTPGSTNSRRRAGRAFGLVSGTFGLIMSAAGPASAASPLDGITPDLSVLGPAFNNVWIRVIGAIWAVLLGACAVKLMSAIYKMRAAKAGGYAAEMSDAAGEAKVAGIAFGALSGVAVIIGAIMFVTQAQ